jgi:hypothetical protein
MPICACSGSSSAVIRSRRSGRTVLCRAGHMRAKEARLAPSASMPTCSAERAESERSRRDSKHRVTGGAARSHARRADVTATPQHEGEPSSAAAVDHDPTPTRPLAETGHHHVGQADQQRARAHRLQFQQGSTTRLASNTPESRATFPPTRAATESLAHRQIRSGALGRFDLRRSARGSCTRDAGMGS